MDPLSIATSAAGIVSVAFKVSTAIYSFINDSRNVDSNVDDLLQEVLGLSRCSEAISQTWAKNPMIAVAQTNGDRDLWISVKNSMDDCQRTLRKLDNKLDELKPGSTIFARGFMRRPNKLIRLNMSAKEIDSFRQQMHSHNNGMQSALLMINVCLLLSSNSSQDSIARVLIGLKTQIGRVESALQGQNQTDYLTPGVAEENQRIANNLRKLVRAAESVHSSASTVVGDARSTVWGGSVMGDALSDEQYNNIQNWIPPATIEEEEPYQSELSGPSASQPSIVVGSTSGSGNSSDQDSDDSDIERHLTKRYRELALSSVGQKDYAKAESFYRKVLDRNVDDATPPDEIRRMRLMLAYVCALQENWEEAENIIVPIAMAKGTPEIMAFHGLHALAMIRLDKNEHDLAIKYCKRAVGGHRKFGGKTSAPYHQSMALLARIYHAKGDTVAAEGCESFLPDNYTYPLIPLQPGPYLRIVVEETLSNLHGSPSLSNIAKIDSRSLTPVPDASGRLPPHSRSHSRNVSNSSFAPPISTSETRNRPVASFREEFSPLSGSDPALSAVEREAALLEMGFDENRVRQAVTVTDTVKDALQWLDDFQRQPSSRPHEHNQAYEATIHPSRETSVRLKHPSEEYGEAVRTEQSFATWKARSLGERHDNVPPPVEEEYPDHHIANHVGPTPAAHHKWATQSGHSTTSLAVEIGSLVRPPNPGGLRPSKSSAGLGIETHAPDIARSRSFTGPRNQRRERGKKVEEPQTHELQQVASGKRAIAKWDWEKAAADEIGFLHGEIITNVDLTNSAWWLGTNSKGERGMFPGNYVKLVEEAGPNNQEAKFPQENKAQKSLHGQRAVALQNWMKMGSDELELSEGELITNVDVVNKGWSRGTNSKGETGLFPSNYVRAVYDEETTWQEGARINGKIILRDAPTSSVGEAKASIAKDAVKFKLDPEMPSTIASRRKAWDNRTPEEVLRDMNAVIGMNVTSTTASQVITDAVLEASIPKADDTIRVAHQANKESQPDVVDRQVVINILKPRPTSSRLTTGKPFHIPPFSYDTSQQRLQRLVISIDLGIESTAVAYAFGTDPTVQPAVINNWPSSSSLNSRVPTLSRYNAYTMHDIAEWGFEAKKAWVQGDENSRNQVEFSGLYNVFLKDSPNVLHLGRKPAQLVEDYLVKLRATVRSYLSETLGGYYIDDRLTSNVWYSFVVPYDLPASNQAFLHSLAVAAKFARIPPQEPTSTTISSANKVKVDPHGITFISDHEAYVVHCIATGILEPRVKDIMLVIDMEDKKVDIVSYEVKTLEPFSWKIYAASSRQPSLTFKQIRLNFEQLIMTRVKTMKLPNGSKHAAKVFKKMVSDFENRICSDFRNNGQRWAVDVAEDGEAELEHPDAGIEEGFMTLSNDDILSCFEAVVNSLLTQIRDQVIAIQDGNNTLQYIVVKGRASTNEYIFRQIQLHVPDSFMPNVKRSQDPECGDVRGAVLATMQHFALEEDTEPALKLEHEPEPEAPTVAVVPAEENEGWAERYLEKKREERNALKHIAPEPPSLAKGLVAESDDATENAAEARISAHGYTYLLASPLAWRYPHNPSIMIECPDGISRCSDSAQVILRAGSSYGLIGDRVRIKKYIQPGDSQVFTDHLYSYPGVLNQGFLNESTGYEVYPHLVRHPPFSISSYKKDPGCDFEIVGTITTDLSGKDVSDWFQKFRGPTGKWYYEIDYEFIVSLETEENETSKGTLYIQSACYDEPIGYLEVPVVLGSDN